MKTASIILLISMAVLSSCKKEVEQEDQNRNISSISALPVKVTDFISSNYPSLSISGVVYHKNEVPAYNITLRDAQQLTFDAAGNFTGHRPIFFSQSTNNSIDAKYTFSGDPAEFAPSMIRAVEFLPMNIGQYVQETFPDYHLLGAGIQNTCSMGNVYILLMEMDKANHMELLFSLSGDYLGRANQVPYELAPKHVTDLILAAFKGFSPGKAYIEINLEGGETLFALFLSNSKTDLIVFINPEGSLICYQEFI